MYLIISIQGKIKDNVPETSILKLVRDKENYGK